MTGDIFMANLLMHKINPNRHNTHTTSQAVKEDKTAIATAIGLQTESTDCPLSFGL